MNQTFDHSCLAGLQGKPKRNQPFERLPSKKTHALKQIQRLPVVAFAIVGFPKGNPRTLEVAKELLRPSSQVALHESGASGPLAGLGVVAWSGGLVVRQFPIYPLQEPGVRIGDTGFVYVL